MLDWKWTRKMKSHTTLMDDISQPLRVLGRYFVLSCTIRSWVYITSKFIFLVTIWLCLILPMIPMWYWNKLHMKRQNSLPSSGLMPIPLLQQLLALWCIRSFHNTSHTTIAQRNGVYARRAALLAGWCMFLPMVGSASTCTLFWLLPKGLSHSRTCELLMGQSPRWQQVEDVLARGCNATEWYLTT